MIKYETSGWSTDKITPVKVLRETDKTIWIEVVDWKGRETTEQRRKDTRYHYFCTWQEAHAHLVAEQEAQVDIAEKRLAHAKDVLRHIEMMREPMPDSPSPACGEE